MFHKSVEPDEPVEPITKEAVLADIKKAGETVIKVVTDVPGEHHVRTQRADGRYVRHYFDDPPVSKAATPAKITDADLSPATLAKLQAAYGGETEEEHTMTTKVKTEGRLGELAKAYAAEFLADENDRKAAKVFEQRCREIQKRDELSATQAMEQAANEFPDDFAEWQGGSPVTAG